MRSVLNYVPLMAFVVIAYNVIALISSGAMETTLISFGLLSGAVFAIQVKEVIVLAGLILLYIEMAKATRTTNVSITDHAVSLLVLIVCIVELIVVPFCGTATFFLLTIMAAIDVVAGFTITITGAKRDWTQTHDGGH